jgi:hypothetical protein
MLVAPTSTTGALCVVRDEYSTDTTTLLVVDVMHRILQSIAIQKRHQMLLFQKALAVKRRSGTMTMMMTTTTSKCALLRVCLVHLAVRFAVPNLRMPQAHSNTSRKLCDTFVHLMVQQLIDINHASVYLLLQLQSRTECVRCIITEYIYKLSSAPMTSANQVATKIPV